MNAIQVYNSVRFYTDRTKGTRYYFQEINQAVNDAIMKKIDSITDTDKNAQNGIDRLQVMRDELYTLVKSEAATAPTGPTTITTVEGDFNVYHHNFPTDYQVYDRMSIVVGGLTTYAKDTTSNQIGPLLDNSFLKPIDKKVFILEDATGLKLYSAAVDTISSVTLTYIKQPVDFNMGTEANLINAGAGVLTINTSYIAVEDSVYNAIVRPSGTMFSTNGALTDLTSGQVILTSLTTTIELPVKVHDDLAKSAAAILLGITDDYEGSGFVEKESQ